jgi:hypothetical protein
MEKKEIVKNNEMTAEILKKMSKEEVLDFIRERLSLKNNYPEIFEYIISTTDNDYYGDNHDDYTRKKIEEEIEYLQNYLNDKEKNRSKYKRSYQLLDKEHMRFDMSGYESVTGQVTIHNMGILNKFADLGIYDYTYYLFLDFYKGGGTIYLQYWRTDECYEEDDLTGASTSEIIYRIFELTIFTDKEKRRRW